MWLGSVLACEDTGQITAGFSPPPSQTFLLSGEFPRLDSRTYRILIPLSSLKNIIHLEQCDNS